MIVKCSDCHASYSVDDSKVTNKKFGFTCPKCGANVIIDNRNPGMAEEEIPIAVTRAPKLPDRIMEETPLDDDGLNSETGGETALEGIPDESEISSILDEVEGQIKTGSAAKKEKPSARTDDFMDFDLSSDDEEILRSPDKKSRETAIKETKREEDEALSLNDFESTEGLDLAVGESAPEEKIDFDAFNDADLALNTAARPRGRAQSTDSHSMDSMHVSQDDFRPLEEDLILEEKPVRHAGPAVSPKTGGAVKSEDILATGASEDSDESITIDLDSLDIQLDEGTSELKQSENPPLDSHLFDDLETGTVTPKKAHPSVAAEDDQDITLDLDTLDITLDEVEEFKQGVTVDEEDERLTLEDAGITLDELESEKAEPPRVEQLPETDEELRLSIDEIDPGLRIEDLEGQQRPSPDLISEMSSDELPEIDFEKLESDYDMPSPAITRTGRSAGIIPAAGAVASASSKKKEDYLDIETRETFERYSEDNERYGSTSEDTVPKGAINFSIDYSLSHSRLGALLRLLGVYYIALLPHYITLFIYSTLSQILGFINWIIVLFTGQYIEDFSEIQEKTVRYMLSLAACQTAVVDEMPVFTGREDIDHALQFTAIYPSKPSRFLSFMRISVIGILLITLPHLIILAFLSLGSLIITVIGLFSILAIKRWPNILFDYIVRYFRYVANVFSFMIGLVDKYPTFRFE